MWAMEAAVASVTVRSSVARAVNSRAASLSSTSLGDSPVGGLRGGTRQDASPITPSGSRLVARIRRLPHPRTSRQTRSAHACRRCSQLSSTMSCLPRARRAINVWQRSSSVRSLAPMADATAWTTRPGWVTRDRSANHTPSGCSSRILTAAWTASRVLPMPADPTNVTSRSRATSSATSASSDSRPIKLVSGAGRLWETFSDEGQGATSGLRRSMPMRG